MIFALLVPSLSAPLLRVGGATHELRSATLNSAQGVSRPLAPSGTGYLPEDGNNWTLMAPLTHPSGRAPYNLAYDSESDRVILFGGTSDGVQQSDTWAYDFNNDSWIEMNPPVRPFSRTWHALAYDSESDRVILFSGYGIGYRNDTWAYDYNADTWTNMNPSVAPIGRGEHSMAYDSESDRVILFGGYNFGSRFDTWAYDYNANTWTEMSTLGNPPPTSGGPGMAYDSESDRIIIFGGAGFSSARNETWAYDYNADTWTEMDPAQSPSPRTGYGMVYDAGSDVIIRFGGHVWESGYNNETWAYDYDNDTWTNMRPASSPSPRTVQGMAFDSESDRTVLFGGGSGFQESSETWVYKYSALAREPSTPGKPENLTAIGGERSVLLRWDPPPGDGGSLITEYRVYRGTESGNLTPVSSVGSVVQFTDFDVTNGVAYYYQVSAANAVGEGPQSNEASATPTVPDTTNPAVTITSPTEGSDLASTSVTVSGTASDDVGVEKVEFSTAGTNWILAEGTTSWSGTLTLAEGPTTIFARATDTSGNTETVSIVVTVDTVKPMAVAGEDQTASVGETVSLDARGSSDNQAIVTYEWDFGDGTTGTGETTTHIYSDPGTYTVTLTVRDAAGNADTDVLTATVETEPANPIPPEVVTLGVVGAIAAAAAGVALLLRRRRAGGEGESMTP